MTERAPVSGSSPAAAVAAVFAFALTCGCGGRTISQVPTPTAPSGPAPSVAPTPTARIEAQASAAPSARTSRSTSERTSALSVPGYLPAVLIEPDDVARPSPLVIVTHGAGDKPEPACVHYDELAETRAFIVCLRGHAKNAFLPEADRTYYYDGHIELGKEMTRARDALYELHPSEIDAGRITFAGFSQGASMGVLALEQGAAEELLVSRLLLVEGGAAQWNVALAERMRAAGVERVAIVCGTPHCNRDATRSAVWIDHGGIEVRVLYGEYAGHTLDGSMRGPIADAWGWLTRPTGKADP